MVLFFLLLSFKFILFSSTFGIDKHSTQQVQSVSKGVRTLRVSEAEKSERAKKISRPLGKIKVRPPQ